MTLTRNDPWKHKAWEPLTRFDPQRKLSTLLVCLTLILYQLPSNCLAAREFAAAQAKLRKDYSKVQPFLVPLPKEYTRGPEIVVVSPLLQFSSNFPHSEVLRTAFDAVLPLIFVHPLRPATDPTLPVLLEVEVSVLTKSEEVRKPGALCNR